MGNELRGWLISTWPFADKRLTDLCCWTLFKGQLKTDSYLAEMFGGTFLLGQCSTNQLASGQVPFPPVLCWWQKIQELGRTSQFALASFHASLLVHALSRFGCFDFSSETLPHHCAWCTLDFSLYAHWVTLKLFFMYLELNDLDPTFSRLLICSSHL